MGRPGKSLEQLVRDEGFRWKRHRELLEDENVGWKALARIQERYRQADNEFERAAIARDFEQAIPEVLASSRRKELVLDDELAKLGPPGSADRAVKFFPRFLWIPRGPLTGRRFRLRPKFQEPFVRDLYERDKNHRRSYTRAVLGIAVGNGKTPLGTGLGLLETVDNLIPKGAVYGVSTSREQAGSDPNDLSRMHALARYWVEEGDLRTWVKPGSSITCAERRSFFKILPSEGRRGFGVDPSFGIFEELGAFIYPSERAAYDAVVRRLGKRGPRMAAVCAITNAGWDKGSLLGEMFDAALKHPDIEAYDHRGKPTDDVWCRLILRDREGGFLLHWWGAHEDADLENPAVLGAVNPLLSKASVGDLLRDLRAPDTDEGEWRRNHGNQWTVAKDAWLPLGTWARLTDKRAEIPPGAEISVAVDAAYSWDTTAVVIAWTRPKDGRVILQSRVWTLRPDAPGHVQVKGPTLDNERLVEPYILGELRSQFRIKHVVYDPNKFLTEGKHLDEGGLIVAQLPPASNKMREAENAFYRAAKDGGIAHDGDEVLKAHVDATAGERRHDGNWRVGRLFGRARPIDACIAAIMAYYAEVALEAESTGEDAGFEWLDESELDEETQ